MQRIDIQVNKSKIYFTPLFNQVVPISYFRLLKNTYLWYDNFKEETFCLLYEFEGRVEGKYRSREGFTIYEQTILMSSSLYRGHRDYGKYVIYEFHLTNELLEYRDLLIEGRYSKFPEKIKETILNFTLKNYGVNERDHIQKILYRDKSLIKEISDKYNVDAEHILEVTAKVNPDNELFANFLEKRDENEFKKV